MMNDYYQNSDYDFGGPVDPGNEENIVSPEAVPGGLRARTEVDFNDSKIGTLPKILLMGPRRGGKTSIQVR